MKQAKKLLSLLIAMTVLCSLFAMGVEASQADYKNSFSLARLRVATEKGTVSTTLVGIKETFDEQPPAVGSTKYWGDTTYTFNNFTGATVEDGMLKMTPTSSVASRYYWNATTGHINADSDPHWEESVVSFNFMVPELGYVEQVYRGLFSKTAGAVAYDCGPFLMINNDVDGNTANYYIYNATNKADRMKIAANQWYRVAIHMNKTTKTFDWYMNGRKIADDSWFANISVDNSAAVINGGLQSHRLYTNAGPIYYDDLMTYKVVPGQTVYFAEDFSGMVGRTVTANESWYDGTDTTMSAIRASSVLKEADGNAVLNVAPTEAVNPAVLRLGANPGAGWDTTVGTKETLSYRFKFTGEKQYTILSKVGVDGNHPGFELWLDGVNHPTNSLVFGRGGAKAGCTVDSVVLKTDMKENTWYNVIMAMDTSDADFASKSGGSCTVYLAEDGGDYVCLGENFKYNWSKTNTTNLGKNIARAFQAEIYDAGHVVTYDDIVIYNDIREDILKAASESFAASEEALGTANTAIAKPAVATDNYSLTWSVDGDTDAVIFAENETVKEYTVTVADPDSKLSKTRTFKVNVPKIYETAISAANGVASARVEINTNDVNTCDGYVNGMAVLAVYDKATNTLAEIDLVNITAGTASLATDAVTTAGEYTAKLFLWVNGTLKPVLDIVDTADFTIAAAE